MSYSFVRAGRGFACVSTAVALALRGLRPEAPRHPARSRPPRSASSRSRRDAAAIVRSRRPGRAVAPHRSSRARRGRDPRAAVHRGRRRHGRPGALPPRPRQDRGRVRRARTRATTTPRARSRGSSRCSRSTPSRSRTWTTRAPSSTRPRARSTRRRRTSTTPSCAPRSPDASAARASKSAGASPGRPTCSRPSTSSIRCTSSSGRRRSSCSSGRRIPARAPLLEPGGKLEVRVVLPNGALLPRTGRLTFVAPSLDSATGTQEFRATFENRDRILLPGPVRERAPLGILARQRARGAAARGAAGARPAVRVRGGRGRHASWRAT